MPRFIKKDDRYFLLTSSSGYCWLTGVYSGSKTIWEKYVCRTKCESCALSRFERTKLNSYESTTIASFGYYVFLVKERRVK